MNAGTCGIIWVGLAFGSYFNVLVSRSPSDGCSMMCHWCYCHEMRLLSLLWWCFFIFLHDVPVFFLRRPRLYYDDPEILEVFCCRDGCCSGVMWYCVVSISCFDDSPGRHVEDVVVAFRSCCHGFYDFTLLNLLLVSACPVASYRSRSICDVACFAFFSLFGRWTL